MGFLGRFSWGFLKVVLVILYISSLPEYSANGRVFFFFLLCTEDAHNHSTAKHTEGRTVNKGKEREKFWGTISY